VAEAPTNPNAEPVWLGWFEDRWQRWGARLASIRAQLDAIEEGIADAQAKRDEAKKTKRSEAAKRAWVTRRARQAVKV